MGNNRFSSLKGQIFLLIAYLLPVALLLWFVANFSVNVLFWDEWGLVNFFDKFAAGSATSADFFAQNNEHRRFFPRIIFLILDFPSKWNTKLEMYFSVFLAIVSFCAMYRIAVNSHSQNQMLFHIFNFAMCVLTFSLVQYENWLWGFQLAWLLINTCVTLAVFFLIVPKKLLPSEKLSLSALLCFIASFSSDHGLLSWIAAVPSVASIQGSAIQKKFRLLLWMVLFTLSLAIYLFGYKRPSYQPPDLLLFLKKPLIAVMYLLTLLGSPIGKLVFSPILPGIIILVLFLFFNIYYLKKYKSEFTHDAAPWLSLGWFAILFALLTTIGRADYGVEQAMSSRYTTVSILLVISVLQMGRLLICYHQEWVIKNAYLFSSYTFFAGILTMIFIFNSNEALAQGKESLLQRSRGEACLEVIQFLDKSIGEQPDNCLKLIFPFADKIIELAKPLQRLGFRDFPKDIAFTTQPIKNYGTIDTPPTTDKPLMLPKNGTLKFSGWAILPEQRKQPKIVLLSYGNNQSFFASAVVKLDRPDVVKYYKSSLYKLSGWEVDVSLSSLPLGETVIKAWVYDSKHKQFVKLSGEPKIKVVD